MSVQEPSRAERRIHRRLLDPWRNPGERGDQRETLDYRPQSGEVLRFSTAPYETAGRDWACQAEIEVR
jgi:hypothetical protein